MATAGALCLLTAASAAYAGDLQQTPPQMQQSVPQQSATPTDQQMRDTSMGGVPMSRTQTSQSGLYGAPCMRGISCDIYHGH
jgi:hypothetical protein